MEFVVFVGILLVFFVFILGITGVSNRDMGQSTTFTSASNILNTVTNEINTASRIDGYYREFYIPMYLSSGENYSIKIIKDVRLVQIDWDGKNAVSSIYTWNVTGNVTSGTNKIKNDGGIVRINEG
jgi:hypothetical protein